MTGRNSHEWTRGSQAGLDDRARADADVPSSFASHVHAETGQGPPGYVVGRRGDPPMAGPPAARSGPRPSSRRRIRREGRRPELCWSRG